MEKRINYGTYNTKKHIMAHLESSKLWAYAILPFAIKIDVHTLFFVTCVTVKLYMSGKSMTALHHMRGCGVGEACLADGQSKTH